MFRPVLGNHRQGSSADKLTAGHYAQFLRLGGYSCCDVWTKMLGLSFNKLSKAWCAQVQWDLSVTWIVCVCVCMCVCVCVFQRVYYATIKQYSDFFALNALGIISVVRVFWTVRQFLLYIFTLLTFEGRNFNSLI